MVPSGAARLDVWYGSFEPVASDALERYEPPRGVVVAFGRSAERIVGFRASHAQALEAARTASLMDATAPPVTSYARVELVSLLADDLPRVRRVRARPARRPG